MHDFIEISKNVLNAQKQASYAGYDPFDALNSKLFQRLGFDKSKLMRLVWLQTNKVLPINIRPALLVPRRRNPKGIALIILGLLQDYRRTKIHNFLNEATLLGDWLLSNRCNPDIWHHACWGYHFDWQARAFYVPEGTPNVITTSYVSMALYELSKFCQDEKYLAYSSDSAYFIKKHLLLKDNSEEHYFGYIPGENTFVHNANLWGAATIARAAKITGDSELKNLSYNAAKYSVQQQNGDGSWVYGSRSHHQFIDGFHTGYNLEALHLIGCFLFTDEFSTHIEKGLDFYRSNFFLEDGTPKYYHNRVFPIDLHSSAQAVLTFGLLYKQYGQPNDLELVSKVLNWSMDNMYLKKKNAFRYQITKRYKNNVNYARWTQAWGYYALAFFNRLKSEQLHG